MSKVEIGGTYKNFKTGNLYKVIALAKHSETLEDMVIYETQYDNPLSKTWVRPLEMFEGEAEWPKGSGIMVERFSREDI